MSMQTMKAVTALAAAVAAPSEVARLPLAAIKPDPAQPRKTFEGLEELAASLKSVGQLEPIKVRPGEKDGEWIIIYGQRRYEAAKLAGLEALDCIIDRSGMSEAKRLEIQLVENALRADLPVLEQAAAFWRLMQAKNLNGKQLAELLHTSPASISRALALLKLPRALQNQIDAGTMTAAEGYKEASQKRAQSNREPITWKNAGCLKIISLTPEATPERVVEDLEALVKRLRKALAAGEVKSVNDLSKFAKPK